MKNLGQFRVEILIDLACQFGPSSKLLPRRSILTLQKSNEIAPSVARLRKIFHFSSVCRKILLFFID